MNDFTRKRYLNCRLSTADEVKWPTRREPTFMTMKSPITATLIYLLSTAASAFQNGGPSVSSLPVRSSIARHQQLTDAPSSSALHAKLQHSSTSIITSDSPSSPFQQVQLETLQRIILPSLLAATASTLFFPPLALFLSYIINDSASFAVLSVDSSQFIQNYLTVTGLTFSILVGQTYYFMYQQQESVFNSLFAEVTEAKSLVEQVALVCQGRGDMYHVCLKAVKR